MAEEDFSDNYNRRLSAINDLAERVYQDIKGIQNDLQMPESAEWDRNQAAWVASQFDSLYDRVAEEISYYKSQLPRS